MENQKYAKIFKILLVVLIVVSVGVLLFGMIKGYPESGSPDNGTVAPLIAWAYAVIGIALASVVCVGLYVTAITNPKGLVKIGIAVVAAAVLFGLCYVLASGAPAINCSKPTTPAELKLTDTILNLAYVVGGAAIASIICGEVLMTIRNKR